MDPFDVLIAERECERLVYDFCHLVDSGRRGEVSRLFADRGSWRAGTEVISGRAALDEYFGQTRSNGMLTRHFVTNVRVSVTGQDEAEAHALVLWLSVPSDGPVLPASTAYVTREPCQARLGEYRDRFTRTAGSWRFLDRERRYLLLETAR